MVQLQTKSTDICRISKLLIKYNVKASTTERIITLNGDISDELLTKLCSDIDINSIQNFISQEPLLVPKETSFIRSEECTQTEVVEKTKQVEATVMEESEKFETSQITPNLLPNPLQYDLLYPEVKRGEVYMCDLGEPYGSEQGFNRYVVVVQNDDGNLHSPTTIVIPCTTKQKKILPVHLQCTFSSHNMIDYDFERVGSAPNVIMAEQIHTVDKTRLRKYIGTLTSEFMKLIEDKIDISLNLSRDVITLEKEVYVDKPIPQETVIAPETPNEHKDLNMIQIQLLSFVDINELLKI